MNTAQPIVPVHGPDFDQRVAETIARETAAPAELAARIYREELNALAREARITQFLPVIARRRACLRLRTQ
jgi:hypothetical protein